jgi:hypothetical protein
MSDVDKEPRNLQPEFQFKTWQLHVHPVSRNGRDVNTLNMKEIVYVANHKFEY